jgi:hypothetical protein
MTTPTILTRGEAFAHAAATLADHLAEHALPEPASLSMNTSYGHSTLTTQLRSNTVPADLLARAETLSAVTVEAWRHPQATTPTCPSPAPSPAQRARSR